VSKPRGGRKKEGKDFSDLDLDLNDPDF